MAVDADDKNFVRQPCCDQLLNNIWHDRMERLQTLSHHVKFLISCITLGLLAPVLMKFPRTKKDDDVVVHNVSGRYEMTVNENRDSTDMQQELIQSKEK